MSDTTTLTGTIEHHDPHTLTIEDNVRPTAPITPAFVQSIVCDVFNESQDAAFCGWWCWHSVEVEVLGEPAHAVGRGARFKELSHACLPAGVYRALIHRRDSRIEVIGLQVGH
jgi:hypothetical protein